MICFDQGNFCFNYRVAGIAVRPSDGYLLMHRTERDLFWSLPGGRCDMDEESPRALEREMREELSGSVQVQVERLLFVVENFFSYDTRRFHEIGLYYQMSFPNDPWVYEQTGDFPGYEPHIPLIYRWVPTPPADAPDTPVAGYQIFPIRLRSELQNLPDVPRHIINRENLDITV